MNSPSASVAPQGAASDAGTNKPSGTKKGPLRPGIRIPVAGVSREAKKQAAALLEVLAGARTPGQAAQALGISLPGYYHLETRALAGLVQACEPRPVGRVKTPASRLAALDKECERLRRECSRQQALARAAQRTVGLAPPPTPAKPPGAGGKRRRRRPTVRALKAARTLQAEAPATAGAALVPAV
jgi:hypothetical protein